MQKHVNLVDLVKSFPTNIFLQNLASMQKRTSPIKFAHLAEKSENCSISNLSTKVTTLDRHQASVTCLLVLEDGRLLSGSIDHTIKFWDLDTGACAGTLKGHREGVASLAKLEGGRLASGSTDFKIKIWHSELRHS